jgi:hypothetical protein
MPYDERERRIQQRKQYKQFLLLNIFKLPPFSPLLAPIFLTLGHIYNIHSLLKNSKHVVYSVEF